MSSRRHRIVHRTTMRYDGEVTTAHNELRMIPVDEPGQATLDARVRVRPLTWSHVYEDHWGTQVMAMESQSPHEVLEIEATSTVERTAPPEEPGSGGWAAVRDEVARDRLSEYLAQTRRTAPPDEVRALAEEQADAPNPHEAAGRLLERVRERLSHESGITGWQEDASEVWSRGSGVCQDLAHVVLGGLRSIGIPARYVSGYLPLDAGVAQRGATVPAGNHAWIELWDGAWRPLDPTDARPVGLDHVVIGRGRDYDDVAPFRGMYVGPVVSELDLEITFTRVG